MLEIDITIEGKQEMALALASLGRNAESVVGRGLRNILEGVFREAHVNLSGAGAKGSYSTSKKTGKKYWKKRKKPIAAGGYPVPVRTGNLRTHLYMVPPGRTVAANGLSVTAARLQAILWDAAEYAGKIHEGRGSSAKYGKRPFATDAVEAYDRKVGMDNTLKAELYKELVRLGLKR